MASKQRLRSKPFKGLIAVSVLVASCMSDALGQTPAPWCTPTPRAPAGATAGELVVVDTHARDTYSRYLPEILRTEGYADFDVVDIADLDARALAAHESVVLGTVSVRATLAPLLANFVRRGGLLVGLRPDPVLAELFGVRVAPGTLNEGWFAMDPGSGLTAGLDPAPIRYHGQAGIYRLAGAHAAAMLRAQASGSDEAPAVTSRQFGRGQAVLVAFDLAQSVVLARQGNPAWAGYPNAYDGFRTMRASQMFFDAQSHARWNATGDGTHPDARNDVPQADEQMHLLANVLSRDEAPQPRLWYFPNGAPAMLLLTGDLDDVGLGSADRERNVIESYGGHLAVYLWPHGLDAVTPAAVRRWTDAHDEVGIHFDDTAERDVTGTGGAHLTWTGMRHAVLQAMADFHRSFPQAPPPVTARDHCLTWLSTDEDGKPDPTAQARIFGEAGIAMDTSFSAFPRSWGYMNGSGLPMPFFDERRGERIPVYEQATQFEDDVQLGRSYAWSLGWSPAVAAQHYRKALDDSLRFHTVVTMLFHPARWSADEALTRGLLNEARQRAIPVTTPRAWLSFWKAREQVHVGRVQRSDHELRFAVTDAPAGLTVLVPSCLSSGALRHIVIDGRVTLPASVHLPGVDQVPIVLRAGSHEMRVEYGAG